MCDRVKCITCFFIGDIKKCGEKLNDEAWGVTDSDAEEYEEILYKL